MAPSSAFGFGACLLYHLSKPSWHITGSLNLYLLGVLHIINPIQNHRLHPWECYQVELLPIICELLLCQKLCDHDCWVGLPQPIWRSGRKHVAAKKSSMTANLVIDEVVTFSINCSITELFSIISTPIDSFLPCLSSYFLPVTSASSLTEHTLLTTVLIQQHITYSPLNIYPL